MPERCPHCGVSLPRVNDRFCPECYKDLDDAPTDSFTARPGAGRNEGGPNPFQLPEYQTPNPRDRINGIVGAEGLTFGELADEVRRGGRLVIFQYSISVVVLSFLRPSAIHLIRAGESAAAKAFGYTVLSLLAGWWGCPWGFIYTPMALVTNLGGGKDVTALFFPELG